MRQCMPVCVALPEHGTLSTRGGSRPQHSLRASAVAESLPICLPRILALCNFAAAVLQLPVVGRVCDVVLTSLFIEPADCSLLD